jgi:hypothetical protein
MRETPSLKKRAKSVYNQRNLGTIKNRKKEKKEQKEVSNGETIMRILRMRYVFPPILKLLISVSRDFRPNTSDFITQQLQIMTAMQADQEQRVQQSQRRKVQRPRQAEPVPAVPPLPPKI